MYRTAGSSLVSIALVLVGQSAPSSTAAPLTPGNLLVVTNTLSPVATLREVTPLGVEVQAISVSGFGESARDLVVDSNGNVQIYNGTFSPRLSTYYPTSGIFSHTTFPGWSTVNNITLGGIAAFGNFVYATDQITFGDSNTQGIVRFDVNTGAGERFSDPGEAGDVNVGLDGLLYVLRRGMNSNGYYANVYDPLSMASIRTIPLGGRANTAIAADELGHVYTVAGLEVRHYDPVGAILGTLSVPDVDRFSDIDIGRDGRLMATDSTGTVVVTDTSLSEFTSFSPAGYSDMSFGAIVQEPVPEPSTLVLLGMGAVGLLAYAWRRRRKRA